MVNIPTAPPISAITPPENHAVPSDSPVSFRDFSMSSKTVSTVCFFSSDEVISMVWDSAIAALLIPLTSDIEFITSEIVMANRMNILNMDSRVKVLRISMLSFNHPQTK